MKMLTGVILGSALILGAGFYFDAFRTNLIEDRVKGYSGIEAKVTVKNLNIENYKKEELEKIIYDHINSAIREIDAGSKSTFLKEKMRELYEFYDDAATELILNEELYKIEESM